MDALMRMMRHMHHDPMNTSMFDAGFRAYSGVIKVQPTAVMAIVSPAQAITTDIIL
jgi:hypothetical protein